MTDCRLVLLHGRAQQRINAVDLKNQWLDAWREGLAGTALPLPAASIRFPYYGDTLDDLVREAGTPAEVIIRGEPEENRFLEDVLEEVRAQHGISDAQVQALVDENLHERGPLHQRWVLSVLRALDAHVPGASAASIALVTRDVHAYLRNPGVRDVIETGVRAALEPHVPTVVVAHSLGTVVAFNLLRREGAAAGWNVPYFITLGSPLAVQAIRRALMPLARPACVGRWFNALDPRDLVALYPLAPPQFAITPIDNLTDVDNPTPNRHGISGYLADRRVAQAIAQAVSGM